MVLRRSVSEGSDSQFLSLLRLPGEPAQFRRGQPSVLLGSLEGFGSYLLGHRYSPVLAESQLRVIPSAHERGHLLF
jgi:hypothetical protein